MSAAHIHIEDATGWPLAGARRVSVVKPLTRRSNSPSPDELARCIKAIAAEQDREAFATLFKALGPRLKTYFMRRGVSDGAAEDLVQDAMLAVWRKASYFDPSRAGVSTWVFTIARNLQIDQLRRERNPEDLVPDPEPFAPTQEDEFLGEERDRRVRAALAELSDEQATIIRLSYYTEQSQTEIAEMLGIPLGTVKSRVRLAMSKLRAVLGEEK